MRPDSTDTATAVRRITLLTLPALVVHVAFVLFVAFTVVMMRGAGVERALDRVQTALLAFVVAALAVVLVYVARSRQRLSPLLTLGLIAWFVALLGELLATVPFFSPARGALTVVELVFGVAAALLLGASAWRAVRHGPRRG